MNIKKIIPILDWGSSYEKSHLKGDLSAGLTVGVMLIPQGMAYAMIAGLPPIYGLYASTIPIIIYALLGTSRQLAVGPVAMVSLLTAAGIGSMAASGTAEYITLAVLLALMVGAIQFSLGALRLGFLINFLSHPVISGFTSAAALIIGLSQLKHLLGISIERTHHVHEILLSAINQIGEVNLVTLGIGIAGVGIIIGAKRLGPKVPGALLAVLFGIAVVSAFGLTTYDVKVVGEVPSGLPALRVPSLDLGLMQALIPTALTIALVSFMESIAVAKAIQAKHKDYRVVPNQELIALGAANIGGAFFQSYPTTGGFSRTAVNDQAGAKTGLAALVSAGLILLTLLFLTDLFYFLPNAILASVIMVAVFGLIDIKEARHLWSSNRTDFVMLLVTFLATLSLGIETGIGIGVLLSLGMVIYRSSRPHYAVLGQVPGTKEFRNVGRFENLEVPEDVLVFRFDADLYFANALYFRDTLLELIDERQGQISRVVLSTEAINSIDSSAIHTLTELVKDLRHRNIEVDFAGVKGPVRDAMQRGGLTNQVGAPHFFINTYRAVHDTNSVAPHYVLQTNNKISQGDEDH